MLKDRFYCTCGRETRAIYTIKDGSENKIKGCKICIENEIVQFDRKISLEVWKYSFYTRKHHKVLVFDGE